MDTDRFVTIISTGQELVSGHRSDSNASFIARSLTANGFRIVRICILGDDPDEITDTLKHSLGTGGFILITGGLGPTGDDRTREAVSKAVGLEPVMSGEALRYLRDMLGRRGIDISERHKKQALIPGGGCIFENTAGTACGFCCETKDARIIAMPGVPEEMRVMFRERVLPFMLDAARLDGVTSEFAATEYVHLFGLSESVVDGRISDMMASGRNPQVGLCIDSGGITISVLARAASRRKAEALLEADLSELRIRLGNAIYGYGDTTLAAAVAGLLREKGWRIAVAESCTGGIIGDMLVDIPGISECFLLDVVAYANSAKESLLGVSRYSIERHGAVSAQVAGEMACGVCKVGGAELGISTTGIAGPSGGTAGKPVGLVYIGICLRGSRYSFRHQLGGDRKLIRLRAAGWGLNHARLLLQDMRD